MSGQTPMTAHQTTLEHDGTRTRWACRYCGWATPWTFYTLPWAGPAAVRHEAGLDREDDP